MFAFLLTFMSCLLKYTFKIPLINFRAIKMSAFELSQCQLQFSEAISCCCFDKSNNIGSYVCALVLCMCNFIWALVLFPLKTHSHNRILLLWAAGMPLYILCWRCIEWNHFLATCNSKDLYWLNFTLNTSWKHILSAEVRNRNWDNRFFFRI